MMTNFWLPVHPGSGSVKFAGHRVMVPLVWPLRMSNVVAVVAMPEPDLGWPCTGLFPLLTHTVVKVALQVSVYVNSLSPEFPKPASLRATE
jgi:hypothetical protein